MTTYSPATQKLKGDHGFHGCRYLNLPTVPKASNHTHTHTHKPRKLWVSGNNESEVNKLRHDHSHRAEKISKVKTFVRRMRESAKSATPDGQGLSDGKSSKHRLVVDA